MKKTFMGHPTDAEIADFVRRRQERRMPGHRRLVAQREAELFAAAVKRSKRKKRAPSTSSTKRG